MRSGEAPHFAGQGGDIENILSRLHAYPIYLEALALTIAKTPFDSDNSGRTPIHGEQ